MDVVVFKGLFHLRHVYGFWKKTRTEQVVKRWESTFKFYICKLLELLSETIRHTKILNPSCHLDISLTEIKAENLKKIAEILSSDMKLYLAVMIWSIKKMPALVSSTVRIINTLRFIWNHKPEEQVKDLNNLLQDQWKWHLDV